MPAAIGVVPSRSGARGRPAFVLQQRILVLQSTRCRSYERIPAPALRASAPKNLGLDLSIGLPYHVSMTQAAESVDSVFRALSDPTRRRVVERLSRSAASVSELAEPFQMALPSFVQHLRVLEECGLVRSEKAGRVRTYRLAAQRLQLAESWLARQRTLWERRLDRLDDYLMDLKENPR